MKKVVLKVDIFDQKAKKKAMIAVAGISGVESVSIDMKEKKLTLTGNVDPVDVVGKLKKLCCRPEIISVGPAKEEKKKEDPKKKYLDDLLKEACYCRMRPQYYYVTSVEENPNVCVIC